MSKRLTGLNPLAYMGVEPLSPAQTYNQTIDPTTSNFQGFNLGDIWVNKASLRAWIYMGQDVNGLAQWKEFASSGGVAASSFVTDAGTVSPTANGVINVVGGTNINTDGSTANTVTIDLNATINVDAVLTGDVFLPQTTDAPAGIIFIGNDPFLHSFGDVANSNTFVGSDAGNLTLDTLNSVDNTGIGNSSLNALTTGDSNTSVGWHSGLDITTGTKNTIVGAFSASNLTTGSFNVVIGNATGNTYTGAESSNIVVSNTGVVGESNVIRIGTSGAGNGQQNKCFIAGIRGITTDNNDAVAVLIDSAGQLGTVSSSKVFKENIVDMRAQSKGIMSLRPVTFSYKDSVDKAKHYGFIAEEVAEIMPELVVFDDQGNAQTVKYHVLPALIVNELQRMNERLISLEAKCNA